MRLSRLGIPQNSRDTFEVLNSNKIINDELTKKLKAMIGIRNIAVHNYQPINLEIVREIIEKHMLDLKEFSSRINSIK
ncbi:MAG: DUF86 domain-containing protein [Clostridiaceae bacterium]